MVWMPVPDRDHRLFTIEEYLALERTEEERHEYLDGCVYAMAGESPDHGRICMNLAVSLGTTARLLSPHGPSMVTMTVLPLSLVPTFLVPLFLIFHGICITQAKAWEAASGDSAQQQERLQHPQSNVA